MVFRVHWPDAKACTRNCSREPQATGGCKGKVLTKAFTCHFYKMAFMREINIYKEGFST